MLQGAILSVISARCFGAMAVQAKIAYTYGMNEWTILLCRFLFGAAIIFTYILFKNPKLLRISFRKLLQLALIGVCLYTTQSLCFIKSLKYLPASTSALILYGYPATVTLLSALFLRLKLTRTVLAAVLLVTGGCVLVFYDAFLRGADGTGLLFAFSAMAVFSSYLISASWCSKGRSL